MSKGIELGDLVLLSKDRFGMIRYYGRTKFGTDNWFGIELTDSTLTRHNGMILNKRYFKCPANKGLFVRRQSIKKIINPKRLQLQNKVPNNYSLNLKFTKERKKRRTPKYKLEKEKQILKSLALIASKNRPISPIYESVLKYDNFRIPNELLSDNESIEISSDEAIIIERNLINHGKEEYKDIFIDNFVHDLNDIEYSLTISNGYNIDNKQQNYDIINIKSDDTIDNVLCYDEYDDKTEYEMGNNMVSYHDNCNSEMFPIEGEETFSEKQKHSNHAHIHYLMINYGLIPGLVYGSINALIVWVMHLLIDINGMKSHWNVDFDVNTLLSVYWSHLTSLLSADLFITTIVESLSIWVFITMLVQMDVNKGKISRLDVRLNDICCNCFLSNHIKSFNKQFVRDIACALSWMVLGIVVFYIPITFILSVFINEKVLVDLTYIQMIIFKASYGATIALLLSPITACFTLL